MREIIKARVSGYQPNFIAEFIINQTVFNVHLTGKSLFEIFKNQCANFKNNSAESIYSETRFQFGCSFQEQCVMS